MHCKTFKVFVGWSVLAFSLFIFVQPCLANDEKGGGDIWFKDTKSLPPVLFSHDRHLKTGKVCADCHDKIFKKEKGNPEQDKNIKMRNFKKGQYCGSCHDGETAFSVKSSCNKCHKP
ncbi:MAG: hypothetical protein COV66_14430 [Nitrospinae bacterium CG11_big_fil_rev_8_21_14_0_20_45_15]|nr:MAG: hypothetical protein COV66_14430 [Nitrospinae bacterium CG11_big_fil_rev_8_21_14_0_20_45_15]